MNGVKFGTKHSYNDFGLFLKSSDIGFPEPKTETVDIPGMDGVLDLTEYFGKVCYKNRQMQFTFTAISQEMEWDSLIDSIMNYLHGKKLQVILDSDPGYYYDARCTIDSFKSDRRTATIVINCDAAPFKKKV